jgi:hypothetical protein
MLAYIPLPAPPAAEERSFVADLVRQLEAVGPVARVVVVLNVVLTGVVGGGAVLADWAGGRDVGVAGLPLGILLFVVLVRTLLRPVDVGGLARLKYDYKGA